MRIAFTGGGTGGHVLPCIAVIDELEKRKIKDDFLYIGSKNGPEKKLIERLGVPFFGIQSGKMRRYFSWQNFLDFFRFFIGVYQAKKLLARFKPKVVFSKGGYVSLPVTVAAKRLRIPVILHESDVSPGLANRIAMRSADKICVSFDETKKYIKPKYLKRVFVTGNPVRESVLNGDRKRGFEFTGLNPKKPVLLVIGGSSGAVQLNILVAAALKKLLNKYQVVHLVGKGNRMDNLIGNGYVQYEYLDKKLKDVYAISNLVVSRGGANALFELALLDKKVLIVPLSHSASRGDQFENAKIFVEKMGWGFLAGDIEPDEFVKMVEKAMKEHPQKSGGIKNGTKRIADLILSYK
ncbi:MAG: UDP-N-acetylglucosamine--N-acetylmuramyl-(pentapeptide) pyrophosphoryl-undecaprenol N-acetylglucosamine transferase [Candidatus Gracilibacteria bacterium]|jgi:UDP-N-acetylglucosamine--N-acetylmuramyl-(pentapeptide) pyrophosphoryl-undecaprenol N-acetylglucosamine transferase